MTDFTKTKMHFALALLGTLFAMHPFIEKLEHAGFVYLTHNLEIFYAYGLMAGLLAVAIYCYAAALVSDKTSAKMERAGNYFYGISILVFPLYGSLYLAHVLERWLADSKLLADWLEPSQLAWVGPGLAVGFGIGLLVVWQVLGWRLRMHLSDQDRVASVEQLAEQEIRSLNRAGEMLAGDHFDLGVIEAWKALEARLRRVMLLRHLQPVGDNAETLIAAAGRAGILTEPARGLVQEVRQQWNVAVGPVPLAREPAEKTLQAVRDILATIALPTAESKPAA